MGLPQNKTALPTHEFDFEIRINDVDGYDVLRSELERFDYGLARSNFRGVLYALIRELAANGFKAQHKRAFYRQLIIERGDVFIPYEEWLALFRASVEKGQLPQIVSGEGPFEVQVAAHVLGKELVVEVRNQGAASPQEQERVRRILRTAPGLREHLNTPELGIDAWAEGGSELGLRLVAMTLEGMGLGARQFAFFTEADLTVARVIFPLGSLYKGGIEEEERARRPIEAVHMDSSPGIMATVGRKLDVAVLKFDLDGRLLGVTKNFLDQNSIPIEKLDQVRRVFPPEFYQDLFVEPRITDGGLLADYRVTLQTQPDQAFVYSINGFVENGVLFSVWQRLGPQIGKRPAMLQGFGDQALLVNQLILPYISPQALRMAEETVRRGEEELPDQTKDATIFFLDLVDFTRMSDTLPPREVMSLLNVAMGICVRVIEMNAGNVDKFLGDGIMAMFEQPIQAVTAAFVIQNQFNQLNEFRALQSEAPIEVRIGIHAGPVVLGSLGPPERREWTAVGDVVNTASRIERNGQAGAVMVSAEVFARIQEKVSSDDSVAVQLKGKQGELRIHSLTEVRTQTESGERVLRLRVDD